MSVKNRIIDRLKDINDPQLLDEILQAVELEHEIEHVHELTTDEKNAIDQGVEDAELENLHSNAEASQLVKKWLKKYLLH